MKARKHTVHYRISGGGKRFDPFFQQLAKLASVKLTVWILVASFVLVMAGTLAQVDNGIYTVVRRYFRVMFTWVEFQLFFPRAWDIPGRIPFPGGLTLGVLLFVNLVSSFVMRFQVTWKRSGLLLTHFGLLLMIVGESVTGVYAREGNMSIDEGSWSNYVEDFRIAELVFIDRSAPDKDVVIAVPQSRLKVGKRITDDKLPFDIQVDAWMDNSEIRKGQSDYHSPVPGWRAEPVGESSGAAADQRRNMPSAHIQLFGKSLSSDMGAAKLLVTTWTSQAQALKLGETSWEVQLRFRRSYRPFQLHLEDFRFDRYMGTDIPMNFSSTIRLVDPERNVDREVLVWMNHPLRYRGETFYQASFKQDESGTVLQVVQNPGWLIPYISCVVVGIGLLIHFMLMLSRFVRRRNAA